MFRRYLPLAAPLLFLAATAVSSSAQTTSGGAGLRSRIQQELFTFGDCGAPLCLDLDNEHGDHFLPALAQGNDAVILFMTDAIGNAPLSVPLGATSGGATFSIVGGLPIRSSISAGPSFGERTQTLGRGRFYMGASVTGVEFTSLNGTPLDAIRMNFAHQDNDPDSTFGSPTFENDVMALSLQMNVNVVVGTLALTYGLTDFIDVGVAVPFVRTEVSGLSTAQMLPFETGAIHNFGGSATDPILRATASMEGTASGIGDVAARLKINLGQTSKMGVGLLAEARLPTGDEENLLGVGAAQIRATALYSAQFGTFSPHVNIGYAARTGENQVDGVVLQGAFDNLLSDWATLSAGIESEITVGENPFTLPGDFTLEQPYVRQFPATNIQNLDGNLLRMSLGAKFTVRGGTVINTNAIFPLREVGLQPDFIWTVGLEWGF
jgi:hypothetical protein